MAVELPIKLEEHLKGCPKCRLAISSKQKALMFNLCVSIRDDYWAFWRLEQDQKQSTLRQS